MAVTCTHNTSDVCQVTYTSTSKGNQCYNKRGKSKFNLEKSLENEISVSSIPPMNSTLNVTYIYCKQIISIKA